eukprot:jgi/Bigna1/53415/estExt_Genewise1Plus.C_190120
MDGQEPVEKKEEAKLLKPTFVQISDLNPEDRGVNLIVKVVKVTSVPPARPESKSKISEATIADKTGSLILTCRTEEQHETVKEGADLIIRNAFIRMYKGYMRLNVDKWGLIEVYDKKWGYDPAPAENELDTAKENNKSNIEYEEVTN